MAVAAKSGLDRQLSEAPGSRLFERHFSPAELAEVWNLSEDTVRRLFGPDAPWCAAGIGPAQLTLNEWSVAAGGHARTGLEDNVRLDRDRLAPSNAALVGRVVDLCARYDRPVATPAQARALLGLKAA